MASEQRIGLLKLSRRIGFAWRKVRSEYPDCPRQLKAALAKTVNLLGNEVRPKPEAPFAENLQRASSEQQQLTTLLAFLAGGNENSRLPNSASPPHSPAKVKQEQNNPEEQLVRTPAKNLQKKCVPLETPPPPSLPTRLSTETLLKPLCAATQTEVHVREEGAQTTTCPLTTGTLLKPQCAGTQTRVHVRDKGAQATTGPALRASKQTSTSPLTVEKSVQTPLPPSEGAVVNLLLSVYTKACTRVLQITKPTFRDAAVGNALVTCSASTQTLARRFNAEEVASWLNSRHQEALRSGAWHLHLSTCTTTASRR